MLSSSTASNGVASRVTHDKLYSDGCELLYLLLRFLSGLTLCGTLAREVALAGFGTSALPVQAEDRVVCVMLRVEMLAGESLTWRTRYLQTINPVESACFIVE